MLSVQPARQEVNPATELIVCFDVSKDRLDGFALHETGSEGPAKLEISCKNRSQLIEEQLKELAGYARQTGLDGLCVVCEPTGGLEKKVLRTARRLGHQTAYANSEHVAKLSLIESGDWGKTDPSDARVISLVARLDRTQKTRHLEGEYQLLRQLGRDYDAIEQQAVQVRCRMVTLVQRLFCDYEGRTKFIFESTGRAVMAEYGWNPYRIAEDGFERFRSRIKTHVKRVREQTVEDLFDQAQSSARQLMPEAYQELLNQRLERLFSDWQRFEDRKTRIDRQIAERYRRLEERGEVPEPFEHLDRGHLGRLIGETGPLADFDHWRELLSYAGLNIRERQSGEYRGEEKITKKGRARLRKVLSRIAYAMMGPQRLFSNYYQRKVEEGMTGIKARVAVMRKLVKLIFGLQNSDEPFDPERVFTCESQYASAS